MWATFDHEGKVVGDPVGLHERSMVLFPRGLLQEDRRFSASEEVGKDGGQGQGAEPVSWRIGFSGRGAVAARAQQENFAWVC